MNIAVAALACWVLLGIGAAGLLAVVLHASGGPRPRTTRSASWVDRRSKHVVSPDGADGSTDVDVVQPASTGHHVSSEQAVTRERESVQVGRPW